MIYPIITFLLAAGVLAISYFAWTLPL
jgi:hypothetical protein